MKHRPAGEVAWTSAGHEHFTGEVVFGPHTDEPQGPDDINVLGVRFDAAARTDWHRHPGGQVLYVLSGEARVGTEGETVVAGPGDAVSTPPGELHWHGAGPDGPMTHLSITHMGATEWLPRKVTDEEYEGPFT